MQAVQADPMYRHALQGRYGLWSHGGASYLDGRLHRTTDHLDHPLFRTTVDPYTVGSGRSTEIEDAIARATGTLDLRAGFASPRRTADDLRILPRFI